MGRRSSATLLLHGPDLLEADAKPHHVFLGTYPCVHTHILHALVFLGVLPSVPYILIPDILDLACIYQQR